MYSEEKKAGRQQLFMARREALASLIQLIDILDERVTDLEEQYNARVIKFEPREGHLPDDFIHIN